MNHVRERDIVKKPRFWRVGLTLTLLILVGINLRTGLLGVPPILPLLSHDLHLSHTETGLLTSLPTLIMGIVSLPIGIMIGRLGGRFMVASGLLLVAIGTALRALWPAALPLYIFTALLSLGSACSQTAIPALIRQWFATRIGLATALYTDGVVVGETLGAGLTIPVMQIWLGSNAWASSFVFWSIPVAITFMLWLWLAPANAVERTGEISSSVKKPSPAVPVHRPPLVNAWSLGLLLGGAQLIYFGTNAWIAPYNQAVHASSLTWVSLGALNAAQLPSVLAITLFADRLAGRRMPFLICGALCLLALAGWIWTPISLEPLWAALLGGATIIIYTLTMALPALLVQQERVALWTGRMLTVGYLFSFLGPFIGGWLWDITYVPIIAFLPLALAAGIILTFGLLLPIRMSVDI
ncbi:MFS transporter [Dictyobacter sp. S3.2.2.5]|uniref:MFS transporter n=1 Tax=Dictyobacter halimunensis TaxID=3026934 RepID=A0ABQ6FK73_9CHLR|nr:MFS transporter [Dictyobacter sp. S3.2.2.5]